MQNRRILKDDSDQSLSPVYQGPSGIEAFHEGIFRKAESEGLNLFAEAPRVSALTHFRDNASAKSVVGLVKRSRPRPQSAPSGTLLFVRQSVWFKITILVNRMFESNIYYSTARTPEAAAHRAEGPHSAASSSKCTNGAVSCRSFRRCLRAWKQNARCCKKFTVPT